MEFALNLLLAGFVIVFFVLILLIVIIKIFGAVVQAAQNKTKKEMPKVESPKAEAVTPILKPVNSADGSISGEIIAVIAAAVDSIYGEKQIKIKSVKRSKSSASAWRNAGLFENTKPF